MTNLMKGSSIVKGVRRKSVIFLVGETNPYVFILPWLLINLYLKQTGNTAQSRRSIQTARRFPESRSAKSKAWIRWLTKGRDPHGQGRETRRLPGRSAGRHPRWASGEGKARPGNRGWRTPRYFGSSTCETKSTGHPDVLANFGGITYDPHYQTLTPASCFGHMGQSWDARQRNAASSKGLGSALKFQDPGRNLRKRSPVLNKKANGSKRTLKQRAARAILLSERLSKVWTSDCFSICRKAWSNRTR